MPGLQLRRQEGLPRAQAKHSHSTHLHPALVPSWTAHFPPPALGAHRNAPSFLGWDMLFPGPETAPTRLQAPSSPVSKTPPPGSPPDSPSQGKGLFNYIPPKGHLPCYRVPPAHLSKAAKIWGAPEGRGHS